MLASRICESTWTAPTPLRCRCCCCICNLRDKKESAAYSRFVYSTTGAAGLLTSLTRRMATADGAAPTAAATALTSDENVDAWFATLKSDRSMPLSVSATFTIARGKGVGKFGSGTRLAAENVLVAEAVVKVGEAKASAVVVVEADAICVAVAEAVDVDTGGAHLDAPAAENVPLAQGVHDILPSRL